MPSNLWELEEAQKALLAHDPVLAMRYVAKALERQRCVRCHESLYDGRPYHPYFKGFEHDECKRS